MYATPGVYFQQVDRGRPVIGPLRTDIAGFVGYAERGPLLAPVKLVGWRQYLAVFGEPLAYAYLGRAVRGFFDNGGAACYVVRIADRSLAAGAQASAVSLITQETAGLPVADQQPAVQLWASHGALVDPVTAAPRAEAGAVVRYDSPGGWGNRLAVSLYPAGLGATTTAPGGSDDGNVSQVESLSGFRVGAIVRLSQGDVIAASYRRVQAIEPHLRQIVWDAPLTGLDLAASIRLETVEFTLLVLLDGQVIEHHTNLTLAPEHERFIVQVIQANSRLIDARVLLDPADLLIPGRWPAPVERLPLVGGRDGLAAVKISDFLDGLATLEKVDEVSILVAPDAVLRVESPAASPAPVRPILCQTLNPPQGKLSGQVVERTPLGDVLLAGVVVQPVEAAAPPAITDDNGLFTLTTLPVGLVALRLQKDGYYPLETTAEARDPFTGSPIRFELAAVTLPPALSLDDIFTVQSAMLGQGERRLYRMALLDPPAEMLSLDSVQTWRARFDSSYAALYYPWVTVQDAGTGELLPLPPSGHIAGLVARADLRQGVHRAPANYLLEGIKGLSADVDDAQQGILNPLGINCLRALPGRGIRVYGARTLSSDPEWRYLNVRRLLLMIQESIEKANQWAVFEPNNQVLRQALSFSLSSFLHALWQQGALAGRSPAAAFQVRCDAENNPPHVVDAGQMIADIAVAPTIPFEFIVFRLGRTVEAVEITE